jgi:hypothetical protein
MTFFHLISYALEKKFLHRFDVILIGFCESIVTYKLSIKKCYNTYILEKS